MIKQTEDKIIEPAEAEKPATEDDPSEAVLRSTVGWLEGQFRAVADCCEAAAAEIEQAGFRQFSLIVRRMAAPLREGGHWLSTQARDVAFGVAVERARQPR